uniref:DUF1409 domain-containing protein n=1 Tax=Oryza meridionalis TaxID=40149 RepID=A0A0E0DPE3_9ORYZ
MSSSTSPSAASSAEYAEHLSNLVAIPSLSYENHYFLGPISNPDPTEFIIGETNRIPFRLANPDLGHWKNTFKSWPSLEKSWITWFKRMSASKRVHWDEIGIGQALDLTIANSAKDEPLMASATYFWSNAINAFLFNQGPMTPTLVDITMITGLDITSSANPMSLNTKNQYDFKTKSIGGWSCYVTAYMTTESSPPHKSNSGRDIEYAPGLIPNGGGPSPPVTGYNAPKTSTLFQGLIGEPADAGKKRRTRSSAMDTLDPAPKKKAKLKKTKPADDLPALDPSIEQALDEEDIEDDVDQAAAEVSDTERTPWASPKQIPPTPSAPVHFSRLQKKKIAVKKKSAALTLKPAPPPPPPPPPPVQQSSSDQTPSAAGSHHVEEDVQPAAPTIPVLADLFSFDIKDYFDEAEEDTTSKALAPLSDDVKKTLEDISHRLEASSLDSLVVNCGSIRTWLHEVQALIPEELADVLTPAAYLEQHQFKLKKAKQRLTERRECKEIEATIQANRQVVHEEKAKLDQLSEGPIKSNIDRLEARKIELLAQLQECNAELDLEHKKLADLPKSVEEQKARLKSAIKNVVDLTKSLKVIPGTDAQDAQAIEESNSGRDIEYAPGLIPNGGGPSPPVIGYDAPKTSALLQGLIREPADASKKRKTRSSAKDTSAPAPKKKTKTKKTRPADDLPALDPSIEQALDEEEIEEDVDQAAGEQSSSDKTPSAVRSHHVEEGEQPAVPAIPVLADLFSFDIKDYFDETEEDTTSKAIAPLSDDVKRTLEDLSYRLEASLDNLLEKARQRLADRRERKDIEATIQHNRQLVHEEKSKLDQLSEGPIKSNIDRLEARKIDLIAQLQECNTKLDMEHKKLADLPQAVEEQKARLKSATKNVADMTKSLKVIPGTDAQGAQAIEEVEQIRQRAISAIQHYLSQ